MIKKLLVLLFIILISHKVMYGQALYGNEWIFDYSKTYHKIKVVNTGLYRIPFSTLQSSGLGSVLGSDFVMYGRGKEIPIHVTATNSLSANDYIEFYAEKNDGWLDAWLFNNPGAEHFNPYYSMINDTAVYFLSWQGGTTHLRMNDAVNAPSTQTPEPYYLHTSLFEGHGTYSGGYYFNFGGGHSASPSTFDEAEGYFGLQFNTNYTLSMSTPNAYTGAGSPGFSADIITAGVNPGSNNINVDINNMYSFGNVLFYDIKENRFSGTSLPISALGNPITPIHFRDTTKTYEGVSAVKIIYPKIFDFGNTNQEYFQLDNSASSFTTKRLVVSNFNAFSGSTILYDFDANVRLTANLAASNYEFLLPQGNAATRNIYITDANNYYTVTSLQPRKFINYQLAANQGNYIMITHPIYHDDGNGNDYVKEYAKYRASAAGGGYDTVVADINMLYDEFAYGIEKHPLAIRNFAHFIEYYFTKPKPFHFLLIGKAQTYPSFRRSPARFELCHVPTFGNPGSDNLLMGFNNDYFPHFAIGRLSIFNGNELKIYLDKIKEYEAAYKNEGCLGNAQTLAGKDWMKQVIHLTGGTNLFEQGLFDGFLNTGLSNPPGLPSMKSIIEDTLFGGHVSIFKKSSSAPVQLSASLKLDSLINSGVSIINFFGHSAYSTLEFAIDNPASYKNYGKYPVLISNGCFTGNLFEDPANDPNHQRGLSERFIVPEVGDAPNTGAIAYISTSDLGISSGLNYYTNFVYQNISRKHYGKTLGECIRIAADTLLRNTALSSIDLIASGEQMLLNGDPAIRVNPHSKPDYVIEASQLKLNPSKISFEQGTTFHVNFNIENIGFTKKDSINILVFRYYPKSDFSLSTSPTLVKILRIKSPSYQQSFDIVLNVDSKISLGANRVEIIVDANNEIDEICENNNKAAIDFNITSLDILPVYPYQYSIVYDTINFSLKGNTVDPLAPMRNYFFQIDTTEKFNSPMFLSTTISQLGGVAQWKPKLKWLNNKVYYWRVAVDTIYGNHTINWHHTSFTFIDGSSAGWDQSHFYEFNKDEAFTMYIDSATRVFKFSPNKRAVKIKDYGDGTSTDVAPYLDYTKLNNGGSCIPYAMYGGPAGIYGGFNIMLFDSLLGTPIQNGYNTPNAQQGDYTCGAQQIPIFQYLTSGHITPTTWHRLTYDIAPDDSTQRTYLDNFLNNFVPNGYYVLMYSINKWSPQNLGPSLRNTFHNVFHTTVIDTMTNSRTYVLFGKKGAHGFITNEVQASTVGGLIDTTFYFSGKWFQGTITTPLIGPATSWTNMSWSYSALESPSTDSTSIELIGVDVNNNETVLYHNNIQATSSFNINWVSASQYPYLKMRLTTKDTTNRTPAQLQYWRINYSPLPEVALDMHSAFNFKSDTLAQGENMQFKIAVKNVSITPMDTFYMKYSIIKNNNLKDSFYVKLRPLLKYDTLNFQVSIPTNNYIGRNSFLFEINPFDSKNKSEQYHFNNLGKLNFYVSSDKVNPLLDVTFDGSHILNGDIVSPKPHILIKLKDENKTLALNSSSLFEVTMKSPGSNNYVPQSPSNSNLRFTPATNAATNNEATIDLNPQLFTDGTYYLRVKGHDRSNNQSGAIDYNISFTVINKSMISNVLNYPNPFTTKTHFVFTLTGSQIPTYFKIQIFTITGKVVKEINMAELGEGMHIGNNITSYAWDGTDEYGKSLANGLYLYRVVTNLKDKSIDHFDTSVDKYFKSGFGKMYLMR
ncbi:MAG: hypothetical protein RI955_965 [Bacteroidota bacterium]